MIKKFLIFLPALFIPLLAFAQKSSPVEYKITTPIPGISEGASLDLGSYVAAIFQFGLAIVGLVSFGLIVFHGVRYIYGASNESTVSDSKEGIRQVIYGIILLFASVVILDTINPCILKTVNFWRDIKALETECQGGTGFITNITPSIQKTQEDKHVENLSNKPNHLNILETSDGRLDITGLIGPVENKEIGSVIISPDGSYQVYKIDYLEDGNSFDYKLITSGDDINQFTLPFDSDTLIAQEATMNFLISKSLGKEATNGQSSQAPLITLSNTNSFVITEKKYTGMIVNGGQVNCSEITSPTSYYRCTVSLTGVKGFGSDMEQIYIQDEIYYSSTLPEEDTSSKKIAQGIIMDYLQKASK